jgi:hypothetical protein
MTELTKVLENSNERSVQRGLHTIIVSAMVAVLALMAVRWVLPELFTGNFVGSLERYLGFSWPFFAAVLAFIFYVLGAWIIELFDFAVPRDWSGIDQALHWATEACPLVGLLTTFGSFLSALLVYGEAGPGLPETQAAFISQFAIAFGSSIAGGVLALVSFTLQRLLPVSNLENVS